MPALIDSLRRDHANMELLLKVLEQEIAVFDRSDRPDFDIIDGIVGYFRCYPAQCHHPKEGLLFAKLKARDPEGAAGIIDIEAEHGQAARRLEHFARLVGEVLDDQPIARGVLDAAVREFVEHERRHMELEERELLPYALASLHAEDWIDLDARLADTRDPLFSREAEAGFEQLKQRIARWERKNQADRARLSQGR
jgi:hemerythrin-like domain-containing protein